MLNLRQSYRLCEQIARTRARNFYFSFLALPAEKRRSMCAVYAFMRYCDDLADDAAISDRAAQLESWRSTLHRVAEGDVSDHPMLPAFSDTVQRYDIPLTYFEEVINGAEMDLTIRRYETFDDLYRYCYRVASVVGLTCLKVFGCQGDEALLRGERCGVAFQLTNIIRDVREDAAEGRIYLPQEDLTRFGCSEADLGAPELREAVRPLLSFQAERAQHYYEQALPLLAMTNPESRASLSAMICIYHRLLHEIGRRRYDVFSERVSLPLFQKLGIAAHCWFSPGGSLRQEVDRGRG